MRNSRGLFVFALILGFISPAVASQSAPKLDMTSSVSSATVSPGQSITITAQATAVNAVSGIEINFCRLYEQRHLFGPKRILGASVSRPGRPLPKTSSGPFPRKRPPALIRFTSICGNIRNRVREYSSQARPSLLKSGRLRPSAACAAHRTSRCCRTRRLPIFVIAGTASSVTGPCPWNWSCAGVNGGANASCSAALSTVAPKVCVDSSGTSHASGSNLHTLQMSQISGSIAATTAQCPNGGAQPTLTTVTQAYLCTNGLQAAQGSSVSTTADNGNPTCNTAPKACVDSNGASHASGSSYTLTATAAGSIAATTTQCPNGGTQPTTISTSQGYMCTNGIQTAQGSATTTTTDNGTPELITRPHP